MGKVLYRKGRPGHVEHWLHDRPCGGAVAFVLHMLPVDLLGAIGV